MRPEKRFVLHFHKIPVDDGLRLIVSLIYERSFKLTTRPTEADVN